LLLVVGVQVVVDHTLPGVIALVMDVIRLFIKRAAAAAAVPQYIRTIFP
jgi:hypothetical protein